MLSFTPGFPMADFEECGMAVFGYGLEEKPAKAAVHKLRGIVADAEKDFALELHTAGEAVRRARERGEPGKPVVLADTQDNPGAGGNGDTTGLLRTLIEQKAQDAVLGLLIDAPSAQRAHDAGQGATRRVLAGRHVEDPGRCAAQRRVHASSVSPTAASPAPGRCSRAFA